jgi:hypothetical protein
MCLSSGKGGTKELLLFVFSLQRRAKELQSEFTNHLVVTRGGSGKGSSGKQQHLHIYIFEYTYIYIVIYIYAYTYM